MLTNMVCSEVMMLLFDAEVSARHHDMQHEHYFLT